MLLNFLISAFVLTVSCKVTLDPRLKSTQITLNDIHSFSEVLVEADFNYSDNDRYDKIHLVIRSSNKHKKQAYLDLVRKYNGIVRMLIKLKVIPNKQSMIQSIVHKNYLRKSRKWQFSRYFIIYGFKQELPQILNRIQAFRPELVKTAPVIHYLDEKFMSIAAFIEAKLELQRFIKEHLNNQFRIFMTKDIEIIGNKIDNEKIIQAHIQNQFNRVAQSTSEGPSNAHSIEGYYSVNTKQNQIKQLTMKVLFQLVQKSADVEDILAQIEEGDLQSHSISDFEDQLINSQWKNPQKFHGNQSDQYQNQDGEQQGEDNNDEL